ncbi:uncharacterized protein UHOD_11230 [Ustilago sp. UG-2017b]|nr:uncharacterized protein UHOD_11230 [Ustilago sp. UG-2017b]
MLYKQIYDEIFPNSNITNGGSHVKTKLRWLESQYIAIKNTFSQTGSGLLLFDLSPDHLDFASHSAAVAKYPWFEMFHKMMSKCPSAGPVTLVTSSAYDPVQASQSSNGDTGDAMCHGPECTGSMKAVGSYGRSTGTKGRVTEEDDHSRPRGGRAEARGLAGTGSRHGRSATSMETMDMEDRAVCMEVQVPPQGGPSSRSIQMVTT